MDAKEILDQLTQMIHLWRRIKIGNFELYEEFWNNQWKLLLVSPGRNDIEIISLKLDETINESWAIAKMFRVEEEQLQENFSQLG